MWARYHQTAHTSKFSSESVTITNPIHPLHGMSVAVRQIRKRGGSVSVLVEHPDGGILCVPVSDTSLELPKPNIEITISTAVFDPKNLLRLAELISTHQSAAKRAIPQCQQHLKEDVDERNLNAEVAPTAPSPATRGGRTKKTLNPVDSTIGGQNARPTFKGASYPSKESNR